jgi:hypothetical protein
MDPAQREYLNLRKKPAIGGFLEVSYITGIHIDGCIVLEKEGHLEALAHPPKGGQRYFSTKYIMALSEDEKWLVKAVRLVREYNRGRNSARKESQPSDGDNQ